MIEGRTLIDRNGIAPVRDAVVVIEGNKITAVGTKDNVNYRANHNPCAQKYRLPALQFNNRNGGGRLYEVT